MVSTFLQNTKKIKWAILTGKPEIFYSGNLNCFRLKISMTWIFKKFRLTGTGKSHFLLWKSLNIAVHWKIIILKKKESEREKESLRKPQENYSFFNSKKLRAKIKKKNRCFAKPFHLHRKFFVDSTFLLIIEKNRKKLGDASIRSHKKTKKKISLIFKQFKIKIK
jgi:hypothetical protein